MHELPALLTTMSICPKRSNEAATRWSTSASTRTSVCTVMNGGPCSLDLAEHLLERRRAAREDGARAGGGHQPGSGRADAGTAAGDHGHLAGEVEGVVGKRGVEQREHQWSPVISENIASGRGGHLAAEPAAPLRRRAPLAIRTRNGAPLQRHGQLPTGADRRRHDVQPRGSRDSSAIDVVAHITNLR